MNYFLTSNRLLVALIFSLHVLVLAALPLALAHSPWWALLLLPMIPLSVVHWGLIHEGIHKLLDPHSTANEWLGRGLGITMGASFHVLRFGHLMHHKLNRDWHGEHANAPTWQGRAYYYANLFFGLYAGEMFTSLALAVLPRPVFMRLARATFLRDYPDVAVASERFFYQRGNIAAVRQDMAASALLYGAAFWMYGPLWPWLLAFVAGRAVVISFLDNIYHYATPADNSKAGKELHLPPAISLALLHSNYHETHHLNPDVPWRHLPQVHAHQQRAFDGVWIQHAAMQLRPPV